jgi:predicted Rossmann fold nucleotide-binding protein DprA/Smf involved in DNA uptake
LNGLADYTIVVSSEFKTGGTWAGASEALKNRSCPVFVRDAPMAPKGNGELIKLGANVWSENDLEGNNNLPQWLQQHTRVAPVEQDLFAQA